MWFHQPYLAKKFPEGTFVKAVGQVGGTGGKLYLANPHVGARGSRRKQGCSRARKKQERADTSCSLCIPKAAA